MTSRAAPAWMAWARSVSACRANVMPSPYVFPVAGFALVPMVVLIAVSRVALGLHYPSDVAAGAVLGTAVAAVVLMLY